MCPVQKNTVAPPLYVYFLPSPNPQFRKAMVKNFSSTDLNSPTVFSTLVRAASKLSIDELARATGGSTEDADTIITVSLRSRLSRRTQQRCRMCVQVGVCV